MALVVAHCSISSLPDRISPVVVVSPQPGSLWLVGMADNSKNQEFKVARQSFRILRVKTRYYRMIKSRDALKKICPGPRQEDQADPVRR
jgi:hypothetical protein